MEEVVAKAKIKKVGYIYGCVIELLSVRSISLDIG